MLIALYYLIKSSEINNMRYSVIDTAQEFGSYEDYKGIIPIIKKALEDGKITYFEYDEILDYKEMIDKKRLINKVNN
jgi:hypothetical protein